MWFFGTCYSLNPGLTIKDLTEMIMKEEVFTKTHAIFGQKLNVMRAFSRAKTLQMKAVLC